MFLEGFEKEVIDEYMQKGYIISATDNYESLSWIRKFIIHQYGLDQHKVIKIQTIYFLKTGIKLFFKLNY